MTSNFAAILYLVAAVCFIMALRGLSSPASARRGNLFGIAGMVIAILTFVWLTPPSWLGAPMAEGPGLIGLVAELF